MSYSWHQPGLLWIGLKCHGNSRWSFKRTRKNSWTTNAVWWMLWLNAVVQGELASWRCSQRMVKIRFGDMGGEVNHHKQGGHNSPGRNRVGSSVAVLSCWWVAALVTWGSGSQPCCLGLVSVGSGTEIGCGVTKTGDSYLSRGGREASSESSCEFVLLCCTAQPTASYPTSLSRKIRFVRWRHQNEVSHGGAPGNTRQDWSNQCRLHTMRWVTAAQLRSLWISQIDGGISAQNHMGSNSLGSWPTTQAESGASSWRHDASVGVGEQARDRLRRVAHDRPRPNLTSQERHQNKV
jgi:hypothetical protein